MSAGLDGLIVRLRDPDRNVRLQAALARGKLNDGRMASILVEALAAEPDLFVRETLTWSMVRFGEAAVPLLIDRLQDEAASVRHDAAHALGKIGDPRALDALIGRLGDGDPKVVAKAAFALGQIGDVTAVAPLADLLGGEDRELESTLHAVLERFSSAAVPALIQALTAPDWRTREQGADALRGIGDPAAAPALRALLGDPCWRVRFAAVNAMSRLGGGVEALQAMCDDDDRRVRALASRVLAEAAQGGLEGARPEAPAPKPT